MFRYLLSQHIKRKKFDKKEKHARRISLASVVIQAIGVAVSIGALFLIYKELHAMNENNQAMFRGTKVAYRGQLYSSEEKYNEMALADDELNLLYAKPDELLPTKEYIRTQLRLITTDSSIIYSRSAEELGNYLFAGLEDPVKRNETKKARKIYLYAQSYLYHVHNSFDYQREQILEPSEFDTWKGFITEFGTHPIFLAAISNGYEFNYFSRDFAKFLQRELYNTPENHNYPGSIVLRNKNIIDSFYNKLVDPSWPNKMPEY